MKKLIAAGLTMAMLLGCAPVCYAAEDAVTTLTTALQNFETEVTVKTQDAEGTLQSVFTDHPELFYYFKSYSATSSKNGKKSTYTFTYQNTEIDSDDVFVVSSADDLYNVVAYALTETMESVPVVFTDSSLNEEDIISSIETWREEYYLAYMGYTGVNATEYTSTESAFSSWTGYTLQFLYVTDTETLQEWRQLTQDQILLLCTTLFALDMPDWEKELLIHDYLVNNCTYDQEAEEAGDFTSANTAYGCLIEGSAVCEGYAEAANLLFRAAGLTSYYVEGAGESADHAWNCVEIDGEYYWVDVTWDDPVPTDGGEEGLYHTYFNLTDSELNTDHSWQTSKYPSCTSTVWSYSAVKSALAAITDSSGTITEVYENYSTENVKTLESILSDLQYELGVSATSTKKTTTEEETVEEEVVVTTTTAAAESTGHPVRTVLLVIVGILVLLVIAYLIYRRIMYLRMLERRRKKAAARKRAAQNGRVPESGQRRPQNSGASRSGSVRGSSRRPEPRSSTGRSKSARPNSTRKASPRKGSSRNAPPRTRRENPFH